ncbi:MAG: RsbRD N-terminal domain-containing protein [Chlorobi bacterium]|nr:RsbRD N-terminal domain-containing protein [Chlorobiota bacterium]
MRVRAFLQKNKADLADKWLKMLTGQYSKDGSKFILGEKDQFANPMGFIYSEAIPQIFEAVVERQSTKTYDEPLRRIIQVRAVQDFTPSQALSFIFDLKQLITKSYKADNEIDFCEMIGIFQRIDAMAFSAFNIYCELKGRIWEIKANEVRKRNETMVMRLNEKYDQMNKKDKE